MTPGITRSVQFACGFAAALLSLRVALLATFSDSPSVNFLLGAGFAFVTDIGLGLLAALLIQRLGLSIGGLLVCLVILLKGSAYYYEAMFGRYPSTTVLYYVSELQHINASIGSSTLAVIVGTLVVVALLMPLALRLVQFQPPNFPPLFIVIWLLAIAAQLPRPQADAQLVLGSAEPFSWLVKSSLASRRVINERLSPDARDRFMQLHGQPTTPGLSGYPLCILPQLEPSTSVSTPKDIVLVVLEGVSQSDIKRVVDGIPVMPNLRRITQENLSFPRFVSAGSKSAQSLTSMYSGLSPNPLVVLLHSSPMLELVGMPADLQKAGYQTAYFHGGDLAFENQLQYLKSVGFEFFGTQDASKGHPVRGWGYDDAVMFTELQNWLVKNRNSTGAINEAGEGAVFASIATVSSHDPYVLPASWPPAFSEATRTEVEAFHSESTPIARLESYRFTDHYLGQFYDWFKANRAHEAILIITSDHPMQTSLEGNPASLEVPFVVVGTDPETQMVFSGTNTQRASHYDIPAVIMGLAGKPAPVCSVGIDLLDIGNKNVERLVYSVIGHDLEKIQVYEGEATWLLDQTVGTLWVHEQNEVSSYPIDEMPTKYNDFFSAVIPMHHSLASKNAYFPPTQRQYQATSGNQAPIYVSHRGNLDGPGTQTRENSREALDLVIESAFGYVELDVQITYDGELVLFHDPVIEVDGKSHYIRSLNLSDLRSVAGLENILTLEEAVQAYARDLKLLIEVKPTGYYADEAKMAREVARIVREYDLADRVIIDSFSRFMASSISQQCDCQVGFDAPFQEKLDVSQLRDIRDMGVDWVYVHYAVYNEMLLHEAHLVGLKVMVYTVNSPEFAQKWQAASAMPDGIITDHETLLPSLN